jgi:hypothetical protein
MIGLLSDRFGRLLLVVATLATPLLASACASGPLGSHGVDYIPTFSTPAMQGEGRG